MCHRIAMMHKIIRELLELAALEQPRVILIEDAQWFVSFLPVIYYLLFRA